jgi:putative PIN family toxin of toxin-antitoxin system
MKVERLVLDTNVWIAALLAPTGTARRLVDEILDRGIDVLMSESTFGELVSRLERPKFAKYRDADTWNLFLSDLVELGTWHADSNSASGISRDKDDDKFLALAEISQADSIVSGDNDLVELKVYEGIPILTPAACLKILLTPEA